MFLAMLIEGPVVTAAGAFAAALGAFNIWIVFILSIFGNLVPDAIYYLLGYWGREGIIKKHPRLFRISEERLAKLEELYATHPGKTLLAVKLLPFLATPGLVVAGIAKVPLKKYSWWNIAITLPSSLFYLIIGYYFGATYGLIAKYIKRVELIGAILLVVFIAIYFISRKLTQRIGKNLGDI